MKKKFIFSVILILNLCYLSLLRAADFDELPRFSSIELKPYNPVVPQINEDVPLPNGIAPYKEQYGRGPIFDYRLPSNIEIGTENTSGTHKNILAQLEKYHKALPNDDKNRNSLLVIIRLKQKPIVPVKIVLVKTKKFSVFSLIEEMADNPSVVEYLFGVFISGTSDYEFRTLHDLSKSFLEEAKLEFRGHHDINTALTSLTKKNEGQKLLCISKSLLVDPLIEEYSTLSKDSITEANLIPSSSKSRAPQKSMIYKLKTFNFGICGDSYRFPPISNSRYINNKAAYKFRQRVIDRFMDKADDIGTRDSRTQALFERSSHIDTATCKACFEGDEFGKCFFQSEPCFLTCLETKGDGDEFFKRRTDDNLMSGVTYQIIVDLYSYQDICRVCRGTFSHLLSTGKLRTSLVDFVKEKNAVILEPSTNFDDPVVYAHSILEAAFH